MASPPLALVGTGHRKGPVSVNHRRFQSVSHAGASPSGVVSRAAGYAFAGGIFKMQRRAGMNDGVGGMGGGCCFGEAR